MLSIIVPTLNAAGHLDTTLAAIAGSAGALGDWELIVADGGSHDRTLELAEAAGARIVTGEPGRGHQLKRGANVATGDWLLFIHADTRLGDTWGRTVARFIELMEYEPEPKAAVFRYRLDDRGMRARLLEVIVELRTWWFALPYGDQGLLISRAHYDEVGGFRPIPIMEDVDIVRRIGRRRLVTLNCEAFTSAGRYRKDGYLRRTTRNLLCLTLWFLGVSPERIARIYR